MALVTLVGEKLAKIGNEFEYIGPNNECRNCKLKTVCFNLRMGRKYKITNVRNKKHNCNVHEGAARVVEVELLPIITCIDKKHTEGSKAKIDKKPCENIGCENYELCKVLLDKEKTYNIVKIYESVKCPLGYKFKKAELSD